MCTGRKVTVSESRFVNGGHQKFVVGTGTLLGLGIESDQNGIYTVAIVEMPDGSVLTPPVGLIKFVIEEG